MNISKMKLAKTSTTFTHNSHKNMILKIWELILVLTTG